MRGKNFPSHRAHKEHREKTSVKLRALCERQIFFSCILCFPWLENLFRIQVRDLLGPAFMQFYQLIFKGVFFRIDNIGFFLKPFQHHF